LPCISGDQQLFREEQLFFREEQLLSLLASELPHHVPTRARRGISTQQKATNIQDEVMQREVSLPIAGCWNFQPKPFYDSVISISIHTSRAASHKDPENLPF